MIEVRNIKATYSSCEILRGIDLDIKSGELHVVIGPNGSGKTTLLKTIVGIIPTKNGEILIDGKNVGLMKSTERARSVAYLSQTKTHPELTVFDLAMFGRFPHLPFPKIFSANDKKIAEAQIERLGLGGLCDRPIRTLSGGQRQKAYIATALTQSCDHLLLDEPTEGLDASCQIDLMRMIKDLATEGTAVLAVMHDLPLAFAFADRVTVISHGEIKVTGAPTEICSSGVIEEVFGVSLNCTDGEFYLKVKRDR